MKKNITKKKHKKKKNELLQLPIQYKGTDSATHDIIHWLNSNLFCERAFKSPQLWIITTKKNNDNNNNNDQGLTDFKETLKRFLHIYNAPTSINSFDDDYNDSNFDLIIFDGFTSKYKRHILWMKGFVQGSPIPVKRRWINPMIKEKNLPVIVFSNASINHCYNHNTSKRDIPSLKGCFQEITINTDNGFDFNNICF